MGLAGYTIDIRSIILITILKYKIYYRDLSGCLMMSYLPLSRDLVYQYCDRDHYVMSTI